MGVEAVYTDNNGFFESPQAATTDVVYSAIATGERSLIELVATATHGDVIGLASPSAGDDYANMAEIRFEADDLIIQRTATSSAVISGATCMVLSGDNILVDGLIFDALDWVEGGTCDANGDASVVLRGDGIKITNSAFVGEASPRTRPRLESYHYISVRGVANTIERSLFEGKDMDQEGAAISIFAGRSSTDREHLIQYNLFKNFAGRSGDPSMRLSTAYAL